MCRKIPRDLTEASLSGAGLSIIAALAMMFLFGMVGSFSIYSNLIRFGMLVDFKSQTTPL